MMDIRISTLIRLAEYIYWIRHTSYKDKSWVEANYVAKDRCINEAKDILRILEEDDYEIVYLGK